MTTWIFEPGHTEAAFRARHMMVTWVRGLFKDIHGEIEFDLEDCVGSTFSGEIDATKIWMGEPDRDAHLRSLPALGSRAVSLPPPDPSSTCLITGASSGIGADIARELAVRGHGVTLVARRADRLRELADELGQRHGIRAEVLACDVTDAAARNELLERVAATGLRTEVLVNNAGFGTAGAFIELEGDREVQMVRTNVEAVVALAHGVAAGMVDRGRGAILNVASSAAFQPIPNQATYAASKAFVLSFSEALSSELGASGVTVTALCPGPVRSEFVEVAAMEDAAAQAPDFLWISSAACAKTAVEGVEQGRRVVVPHPPIRAGATLSRCTPHSILLPLMRRFYPA